MLTGAGDHQAVEQRLAELEQKIKQVDILMQQLESLRGDMNTAIHKLDVQIRAFGCPN